MRSARRMKTTKSAYRSKIRKKRHTSRSVGCTPGASILDLQNINEVLRVHKTQRAEGKGAWKIVPKDSCEVYKNRRKRQAESNRHEEVEDANKRTTDSDNTNTNTNISKRRKRSLTKKTKKQRRPRHRREQSSASSNTTTTTSCHSCISSSDMDYE